MQLHRARNRLRRLLRGAAVPTWYDECYRLPMASIAARLGIEPRRADFAVSYLLDSKLSSERTLHRPERIAYADVARVHSHAMITRLHDPEELARIFGVDVSDVHVDETLRTLRLACGGTLAAAREALRRGGPTMNLLGGFHHAAPDRAASLCAFNDVAVAIAALRAEGFDDQVAVIDLDAHPPDGTADCLRDDDASWIGSLSGSDWGALAGVDETVLREGASDGEYLVALADLLSRMPTPRLAFVIAGGDVVAGDRMGLLGLTLEGARQRDRSVAQALDGIASVWLPGGGYHDDSWRVIVGTALALTGSESAMVRDYDAVQASYARIAKTLAADALRGDDDLASDVLGQLSGRGTRRFLDYYTAEGIEYALERYGILDYLARLGYRDFRVAIHSEDGRHRMRLHGKAAGSEHLLVECVLERRMVRDRPMLYVHWLTLQDAARRLRGAALPGQEHPGLNLARESGELFRQMAERLGLAGVAFTPAWYHMAYFAREGAYFVDPARQGRFEAMVRDLGHLPVREVSAAVALGRVTMNGAPYSWEASDMVAGSADADRDIIDAERARVRFAIA